VLPQVRQLPGVQSRILLFVLFAPHPHGIHDGLQAPAPRGPFFLFYGTDAVLVKQGPGTPHIRLKKIFSQSKLREIGGSPQKFPNHNRSKVTHR